MASGESTITGRRPPRNLGLSVFNPDNSSDDEQLPSQRSYPQTQSNPAPKPLPIPGKSQPYPQQSLQPQLAQLQQQQQPYARPPFRQPSHPVHSASSSTSSISISTASSSQFGNGTRQTPAQSSPINRYATASPHTYVGSSSSSRSSPAMDTTPPPSTPSSNIPPVNFAGGVTDDRNLDGLGLSVVDNDGSDYTPQAYTNPRSDPRNGLSSYAESSMSGSQSYIKQSPAPTPPILDRRDSVDRLIITATADAENHVIVDITGAKDATFIRQRIFQKLRIPESEYSHFAIFRTEIGEAALGDPVSDDQLMIYCEAWADGKGTLKFLVQRMSYPPLPQSSSTTSVPSVQHAPSPPVASVSTPPFSPSMGRRGDVGGHSSADRDRDRAPWDRVDRLANGYEGDVDRNSRRHQSPAPIDTSRRRREPSASSSDYGLSPTSPQASGSLPQSMSPLIARRPQHSLGTAGSSSLLAPQPPASHRRRESETAAQERERALEESERQRENQIKEYDTQYRRNRVERERQNRRQPYYGQGDGSIPPMPKSHRSESVDSGSGPPHGWVMVNEVFPNQNGPNSDPSRYGNSAQRSASFGRSNTTGNDPWIGSPPSDSPRFSPGSAGGATTPSSSRPYPHANTTPFGQPPAARSANGNTTPLQRSHPPLPSVTGTGKYPNPYPHPRSGTGAHAPPLPPGAVDPRMKRELERQQSPIVSNAGAFYSSSVSSTMQGSQSPYTGPTSSQSSRMLQPTNNSQWAGLAPGQEASTPGGGGLRSPRSLSDLRQFSPTSPAVRNNAGPSTPSQQVPTYPTRSKPSALPTSSAFTEGMYGAPRPPPSPNRIPQPSSRGIVSPSSFYTGSGATGGGGSLIRSPATPLDYTGGSNLPRSLGNTSLFSGGMFADAPISANRLRSKQSSDRLNNALDRTMAAHREPPPPVPALPANVTQQTPGGSYRYGWLSSTASPTPSRPQSGDTDADIGNNKPSPIESTPSDALSRLEARRPSVPMLSVPSSIDDNAPLTSPYSDSSNNSMQIPHAVVTPSTPIDQSVDTGTMRPGVAFDLRANGADIPLATSPAISATSSQELTDDGSEGTLRPGDRAYLMSLASGSDNDADVEGTKTMKPRLSSGNAGSLAQVASVVTGVKRVSLRRARAKSIRANSLNNPADVPNEDAENNAGEYDDEEFYSDEEEEDDDRFWNTPAVLPTPPAIRVTAKDDDGSSTFIASDHFKGRGPSLTLQMPNSPADGSTSTPETTSGHTLTPSQGSPAVQTPTSTINRRASFRRDTWAFRPSAEDVYDRLQDFFPDHDLDKPFIEPVAVDGPPSPKSAGGPAVPTPPPVAAKDNKFKHRKSIRFVAEERKRALERIQSKEKDKDAASRAANLARKRSTKLWGNKVEEITPGQVKSGLPSSIPESPEEPARPTMKWVKGELIGKGTYGKVFLAMNVTTGEMLAVKQVEMPQTISDQDDVRQVSIVNALKAERETLETLDHPNIVQYLGFEQTKEFFSVFLEYVPGGSIGSCLRKHGKFAEDIIKSFTGQVVDGLAYLHDNKIIHRDVKADNVLVDLGGTCKISDFGISKRSDEIYNNAAMTAMQGSLFWMAPEMLHNNKKGYNAKIDIWSLGCVFIEMFAGRRPWEQDDFVSVMFKVGHNKMAPPVPEDVHLSPEADDFRLKCFTQDPDERPTAQALQSHPWLILPRGWKFPGF